MIVCIYIYISFIYSRLPSYIYIDVIIISRMSGWFQKKQRHSYGGEKKKRSYSVWVPDNYNIFKTTPSQSIHPICPIHTYIHVHLFIHPSAHPGIKTGFINIHATPRLSLTKYYTLHIIHGLEVWVMNINEVPFLSLFIHLFRHVHLYWFNLTILVVHG